jgi:hypothetical protein
LPEPDDKLGWKEVTANVAANVLQSRHLWALKCRKPQGRGFVVVTRTSPASFSLGMQRISREPRFCARVGVVYGAYRPEVGLTGQNEAEFFP